MCTEGNEVGAKYGKFINKKGKKVNRTENSWMSGGRISSNDSGDLC